MEQDILDALQFIDCAKVDYSTWISVGMALKHEGYSCNVWDEWSKNDPRYQSGQCEKKWETFQGTAMPVTAGTIIKLAQDNGYCVHTGGEGYALGWEDTITREGNGVDTAWLERVELQEPTDDWKPEQEVITYLKTLFHSDEIVGYVTEVWEKGGKKFPSKGSYDRTAGELIRQLEKCKGDIGAVLGDYDSEAGAWVRFNPLDGNGVKNDNVTEYRYALVESDAIDIETQNALIRELNLPVACLMYSGGKSLHAIVHIGALDYDEYRKRVDYLYKLCQKNGLQIDTQNKNPSRLSRLPGVVRNGRKQYIVDTNIGAKDFNEWEEWIEGFNDDLPDPEDLSQVWDNVPELAPCLIEGVLRQGHKMLLTGPSKAGKSFSLIELCIAIAEGKEWLGFPCTMGRVMYVNLELDRASCLHRFQDVYRAKGWLPNHVSNIDVWNLRGHSVPMDKLAPKLIRRAQKKGCIAVVVDPIYKIITGDENDAYQMSLFCNQFDRICRELGASVIICHHHSKGFQGAKKSRDRGSGSGVFARDPDAVLDLIELEQSDEIDTSNGQTAWRLEGDLREFQAFEPVNIWFDYPIHIVDKQGQLSNAKASGETSPWERGSKAREQSDKQKRDERNQELLDAYNKVRQQYGKVTVQDLTKEMKLTRTTLYNRLDACPELDRDKQGRIWVRITPDEPTPWDDEGVKV